MLMPGPTLPDRVLLAALALGTGTVDAPVALVDLDVVDARLAAQHQAVLVELPKFVSVAAPPLPVAVDGFVLEAHGDPVLVKRPQVLAQRVIELALPLLRQERHDLRAPVQER